MKLKIFNRIKNNSGSIIAVAVIGIFVCLDIYKCPISLVFGISCPTCGVTRALISLVQLDFSAYAEYNIMALPLLAAFGLALLGNYFKRKKFLYVILYSILAVNSVYYAVRLVCGAI